MKKAIVTLCIGEKYKKLFDEYCRSNWTDYCNMFNFDLIVIDTSLDASERALKRSPSWQKLLILSQSWSSNYDQIVWVDTDVIINTNNTYDITSGVPLEKVGGVDQYAIPTKEIFDISLKRLYDVWTRDKVPFIDNRTPASYYMNRGLPVNQLQKVMQAGVFVCSPIHHREKFEFIYNNYEDTHGGEWNFENPAMSYELVKDDLVKWIAPQFNFCVINIISAFYPYLLDIKTSPLKNFYYKIVRKLTKKEPLQTNEAELLALKNIYELSVFMHFAGCPYLMPKMKKTLKTN